jgi:hypothetical protein
LFRSPLVRALSVTQVMLEIDVGESNENNCECCGNVTKDLTRFVYQDNDAFWKDVTFLGRILDRGEALKHEWISDVFHITDHMVADDKEIVGYFSGVRVPRGC